MSEPSFAEAVLTRIRDLKAENAALRAMNALLAKRVSTQAQTIQTLQAIQRRTIAQIPPVDDEKETA